MIVLEVRWILFQMNVSKNLKNYLLREVKVCQTYKDNDKMIMIKIIKIETMKMFAAELDSYCF